MHAAAVHHVDHRHRRAHCKFPARAIDILIQLRRDLAAAFATAGDTAKIIRKRALFGVTVQTLHFHQLQPGQLEPFKAHLRNLTIDISTARSTAHAAERQLAVPKLSSLQSQCSRQTEQPRDQTNRHSGPRHASTVSFHADLKICLACMFVIVISIVLFYQKRQLYVNLYFPPDPRCIITGSPI